MSAADTGYGTRVDVVGVHHSKVGYVSVFMAVF